MYVLHQGHALRLQCGRRGGDILGFQVEMKMLTVLHELNGGILIVNQFQVEGLVSGAYAGVEILVLKLQPQSQLGRIEANR